jgi:hypothetical protein
MFRPSFIGFLLNGLLLGISFILFIIYFNELEKKDIIIITLVGSIAIGIHSMLHFREEKETGFMVCKKN